MVAMSACCWVFDIVEIKSPIPRTERRYTEVPMSRSIREPFIGTSNQNTPAAVTSAISANPKIAKGIVYPSISSAGLIGVTISCSMVPASLSRTTAIEVSLRHISMIIEAITPGTL